MLQSALKFIQQTFEKRTRFSCVAVSLLVLTIDYVTGKHIEFPILYALPVGIAASRSIKNMAYAIAVLLPLARAGFHYSWNEPQPLVVLILNIAITSSALVLYAYFIGQAARETKELEKEVKELSGILPICASCKRIKNENGRYEQIEKYITEHSGASFSHGLCPECVLKLYPEYIKK